jgi:DNA-binding beta-propeller fold protein YncE
MHIFNKKMLALAVAGLFGTPALAADSGDYALAQPLQLGAATKWDFISIDAQRQRLFVTRGDRVDVVEIPSGKIVGMIPNTLGVHGVALAQDLKLGFTSNGKTNSVTVFDLETLAHKADIALTGKNPDVILYEPLRHQLYVFNGASANVEVIDGYSLKLIANIKATGRPEFAVADGHGKIFFNVEDKGEIDVIDTATHKLVASWPLKGCVEPTGLALDVKNARLFSACANGIMAVTDAHNGKRVAQFAIGEHPDAVIYDEDTRTVLTSGGGGAGTLAVAHQDDADHYTVRAALVTAKGAKTMAMNPGDKSIYLPTVIGETFVLIVAAKKP